MIKQLKDYDTIKAQQVEHSIFEKAAAAHSKEKEKLNEQIQQLLQKNHDLSSELAQLAQSMDQHAEMNERLTKET